MRWDINKQQNSNLNINLLAARLVQFKFLNLLTGAGFIISIIISIWAVSSLFIPGLYPEYLALFSLIYTLLDAFFIEPEFERRAACGAGLMEEFDTNLFGIEENPNLQKPCGAAMVSEWAERIDQKRRSNLLNWHSGRLGDVPQEVAALIAQYSSTAYDQSLRLLYSRILTWFLVVLILGALLIAFYANIPIQDTVVRIFVPLLPIAVWAARNRAKTLGLITDQAQALSLMDQQWKLVVSGRLAGNKLRSVVRDNQDAVYRRRTNSVLIFPLIYKALRPRLEASTMRRAEDYVSDYLGRRS